MQPLEAMAERSGGNAVSHIWTYAFDTQLSNEEQIRCTDSLGDLLSGIRRQDADDVPSTIFYEGVASNRDDFYATYGGLFFLGVLLSVGFSLAAVLIIYYKQISEGLRGRSALRHHAEGRYDPRRHPPQRQQPDAARVLPAAAAGGGCTCASRSRSFTSSSCSSTSTT